MSHLLCPHGDWHVSGCQSPFPLTGRIVLQTSGSSLFLGALGKSVLQPSRAFILCLGHQIQITAPTWRDCGRLWEHVCGASYV